MNDFYVYERLAQFVVQHLLAIEFNTLPKRLNVKNSLRRFQIIPFSPSYLQNYYYNFYYELGYLRRYSESLWVGRSGDRIPMAATFPYPFRPALEPTQPPVKWVLALFSQEVKRPGQDVDHLHPLSAEVKEGVEL